MNLKGAAPETFGAVASWLYRALAQPMLEPLYRRVAAEIPIRSGRLLDIGCGTGRLARLLAEANPALEVVGLDASPDMIEQARRGKAPINLAFRQGAIERAGLDSDFDFAVTLLSFHHWEEPRASLEAVHRALSPCGRFWIYESDPDAPNEEILRDHAPLWGWLRMPLWLQRRMSRGHGFSRREVDEDVAPLVAGTSFKECEVSGTGSTLRLEFRRTGGPAA